MPASQAFRVIFVWTLMTVSLGAIVLSVFLILPVWRDSAIEKSLIAESEAADWWPTPWKRRYRARVIDHLTEKGIQMVAWFDGEKYVQTATIPDMELDRLQQVLESEHVRMTWHSVWRTAYILVPPEDYFKAKRLLTERSPELLELSEEAGTTTKERVMGATTSH